MTHMQMNIHAYNTHSVILCKPLHEPRPVNRFSPKTSVELYVYNKGKVTYKVNFDAVDILISVRLLIMCKVSLKEARSQPLASKRTLSCSQEERDM